MKKVYTKKDLTTVLAPNDVSLSLAELIDMKEQKEKIQLFIDYINNPSIFSTNYAPTNRLIFCGADGTGKKTFATAFAKEVDLPIIFVDFYKLCSISSFSELFTLVCEECKKYSSCILYFNEIDYITEILENEDSLSIYSELLSFLNLNPNIFTILSCFTTEFFPPFISTNGKFETTIKFNLPELKTREELFKYFCNNLNTEDNIDFYSLAKNTFGFSINDIQKVIKKTVISNTPNTLITFKLINDAISTIICGDKKKQISDNERELAAYHEAGHALVGYYLGLKNITKIDIVHREESLGITYYSVDENKFSWTRNDYFNEICFVLGGMAAEKQKLNHDHTSGVSQDLLHATTLSKLIISDLGMNKELGPIFLDIENWNNTNLQYQANLEISNLLKDALSTAQNIINTNQKELTLVANLLLEKEIITFQEMIDIIK